MHVYPRIAVLAYVFATLFLILMSHGGVDQFGKPLGADFIAFWGASHLTLESEPAAAFDERSLSAAEQLAVPGTRLLYHWRYPPTYQLLVTPLALLPYGPALLLFLGLTLFAYLLTVRHLLDQPEPVLLLLALPGTFVCALQGQNAFLTATLLAGGILALPKRSVLAGVMFGLLVYKPQYGVLIPIALLAGRQWRAFWAASVTVVIYIGVTIAIFGLGLWRIFFANLNIVTEMLEQGLMPWAKMPSAFVFLRMLGAPVPLAYIAQGSAALIAAASVVYVWHRCGPSRLAGAVLVSATLVSLDYIFDYAFVVQSVALAILATDMARRGADPWEKRGLLALLVVPLLMTSATHWLYLQIGFPALVLTLILCFHRAIREGVTVSSHLELAHEPVGAKAQSREVTIG